ncbi:methyl-accepting chemotaxis protein [Marinomonas sp.]|nr:methyl-accepting chemotaxis protein [Marinomonas sp.]MDB4837450.1 methyl-accepting chemotaxis protein [Marinomonas sp.]
MDILKNRSIGQKIGIVIGTILCFLAVTSTFGVIRVTSIGHELQTIHSEEIPLTALVSDITIKQLEKSLALEQAFRIAGITDSDDTLLDLVKVIKQHTKDIDLEIKKGEAIVDVATSHAISTELKEELELISVKLFLIESEHAVFETKVDVLLNQLLEQKRISSDHIIEIKKAQHTLNSNLEALLVEIERMTKHTLETAIHHEEAVLTEMIGVGIASIISGLVFGIIITRLITKPLSYATSIANKLSHGDLTAQIEVSSKDETGKLLSAMKVMTQNLLDMVNQIAVASEQLTQSTHKVAAVTHQTASNVLMQNDEFDRVVMAMDEMSCSIQAVATSAQQSSQEANLVKEQVVAGQDTVQQASHSIHTLAKDFEGIQSLVTKLESETTNVDAILDVITSIAEQTNLLALNAAIEAARAGEQGRGFAVVADEVRTLASRTQESINEVQGTTDRLKDEAKSSSEAMSRGYETTQSTVAMTTEAERYIGDISYAIEKISDVNLQVANAAAKQSSVTEDIHSSITRVSLTAKENSEGISMVNQTIEEVESLSLSLRKLVSQFKVA